MFRDYRRDNIIAPQIIKPKLFSNINTPDIFVYLMFALLTGCASFGGGTEIAEAQTTLEITDPTQGTLLNTFNPINVSGVGTNLPGEDIVVQALDRDGAVIAETTANITSSGAEASGTWTAQIIIDLTSYTTGKLIAFLPAPDNGETLALSTINVVYRRTDPKAQRIRLQDHHWSLKSFSDHEKIADTYITAEFARQITGVSGCNEYFGYYQSAYGNLRIARIVPTSIVCDTPDGVMEQEILYLSLLEQSRFFRVEDCQLRFFDESDEMLLSYNAAVIGGIFNDQEMEIPPGSSATITLEDTSQANSPATMIAEETVMELGDFPVSFIVTYCPNKIVADHTYNLRAKITDENGELLFKTASALPVITMGNPTVAYLEVESIK